MMMSRRYAQLASGRDVMRQTMDGTPIPLELLEAYGRAEITRREIATPVGHEVSSGALVGHLYAERLPLPRVLSGPSSPGVQLIRQLAARQAVHGG
jgi:hypothetical protein